LLPECLSDLAGSAQQQDAGVAAAGWVPEVTSVPQQATPTSVGAEKVALSARTV
jgi:hypothetical protein